MTSLSRTLSVVFAPSTALFLATRTGFRSPTARTHLSHAARRSVAAMADPASAATAEPRTGFHTAPDELIQEALGKFFDDPHKCTVTSTKGGVNNVVQYVSTPEGERFILRIYSERVGHPRYNVEQISRLLWFDHQLWIGGSDLSAPQTTGASRRRSCTSTRFCGSSMRCLL